MSETIAVRQHRLWRALWWGYLLIFAVFAPAALILAPTPALKLQWALFDAAAVLYSYRVVRACIRLDENGVLVRNVWGTRTLGWTQVRSFGVRRWARTQSRAFVETVDGRRANLSVLVGIRWGDRDNVRVVEAVERLNRALAEARQPTAGQDTPPPGV